MHEPVMTPIAFTVQLARICDWFTGVPSSGLTPIMDYIRPTKYHFAPREDHALAMAFGARLMGAKPCVFMQNSGVGYIGDVIQGLNSIYQTGVIMVIDCIGEDITEPPQHVVWGYLRTYNLLHAMGAWIYDPSQLTNAIEYAGQAAWVLDRPTAILLREGVINED